MDSVTRLRTISVVLSMLTRVGCWVRLTAVTIIQTASKVMVADTNNMATVTGDMEDGEVSRVLGSRGRKDTDNIMFQTPELIIRWSLSTFLLDPSSSSPVILTWTMLAALMVAAATRHRPTPSRYSESWTAS